MTSLQGSKFIPDSVLLLLQARAQSQGHYHAVLLMFDFPEFDLPSLKERVHWHYVNDASSFCDAYLLERSWIRGFEDLMCWAGHRIHFLFEIDQYIRDPILPKKIDNPK